MGRRFTRGEVDVELGVGMVMPCSRQVVVWRARMSLEVVGMFCRVVSTQSIT